MTPDYASRVVFDIEDALKWKGRQSFIELWKYEMREAIKKDLWDEPLSDPHRMFERAERYSQACEEVIEELVRYIKAERGRSMPVQRDGEWELL